MHQKKKKKKRVSWQQLLPSAGSVWISVPEAITVAKSKGLISQVKCPPAPGGKVSPPRTACSVTRRWEKWMPEGRWKHQVASTGRGVPAPDTGAPRSMESSLVWKRH